MLTPTVVSLDDERPCVCSFPSENSVSKLNATLPSKGTPPSKVIPAVVRRFSVSFVSELTASVILRSW